MANRTIEQTPINIASGGDVTIATATENKIAQMRRLVIALEAAGTVQILASDDTALTGLITLAQGQPLVIDPDRDPDLDLSTTVGLGIKVTATQNADGFAVCTIE